MSPRRHTQTLDLDAAISMTWDPSGPLPEGTDAISHFKVLYSKVHRLETLRGDQLVEANRLRLGAVAPLAAEQPPKGQGRGNWQLRVARQLGIKARRLRDLLAMHDAVVARLADGLPNRVLRRPPEKVPQAAENWSKGLDMDTRPPRQEKTEAEKLADLRSAGDRVITRISKLSRGRAVTELRDLAVRAFHELQRIEDEGVVNGDDTPYPNTPFFNGLPTWLSFQDPAALAAEVEYRAPTTLAEKHQPRRFDEILNNRGVVDQVAKRAKVRDLRPLFLLGPSGCGKSTLGRIYLRSVLCPGPRDNGVEPCGRCATCLGSELREFGLVSGVMRELSGINREETIRQFQSWLRDPDGPLLLDEVDGLLTDHLDLIPAGGGSLAAPLVLTAVTLPVARGKDDEVHEQFLSRYRPWQMKAPTEAELVDAVVRISAAEGNPLSPVDATRLVRDANGLNFRSVLQDLQDRLPSGR